MQINAEKIAKALEEAEAAHAKHEKELGYHDSGWAKWYATWLIENHQELFWGNS